MSVMTRTGQVVVLNQAIGSDTADTGQRGSDDKDQAEAIDIGIEYLIYCNSVEVEGSDLPGIISDLCAYVVR